MIQTDWDALFPDDTGVERDAVVAFLYHEAEALRSDVPQACFYLRRAAEAIVKGEHLGA